MAKHHPILTLFSSLVMEAPLSSGWTRRGSRMGGRALGTLIPLDGRWSSTPLERPMKRRDRCRDRRTVPLDASGCGFPSTAGSQASNVLNSSGAPVISIYVQPRRRSPRRGEYLSILSGTMRRLKERTFTPSDRAGLTSSIVLGMTALFQMDGCCAAAPGR